MRIDQNTINAVKAASHNRIIVEPRTGLVFSCQIGEGDKWGDKGVFMVDASVVNGAKSIVYVGDIYIPSPYIKIDLKNDNT